MVVIREAKTRKDFKKFVKFPTELYKDNPYYVPPFELDELNLTNPKKNASFEDTDAIYFLAERDGKVVGRIAGLICHLYNKKNNAKRARFSRFDFIDDAEVADSLLKAAEDWARSKGMVDIHGPLGFNDLEREGLLVEGFETIGTYQGSWNAAYYKDHIERNGYVPDAKWVEWRFKSEDKKVDERVQRVAKIVETRYGFHEAKIKSAREVIKKYGRDFFKLLDECFEPLYGTIPFTDKLVDQTIGLFKLIIDTDYVSIILDKNGELAAFGLGYASLARAIQKAKGRYLPFGWIHILHAIKHPKYLELGLVAVKPKYQKMGLTALIINNMMQRIVNNGIIYCDTGCQLETNTAVLSAFDMIDRELIRRKTCYLKKL